MTEGMTLLTLPRYKTGRKQIKRKLYNDSLNCGKIVCNTEHIHSLAKVINFNPINSFWHILLMRLEITNLVHVHVSLTS